MVVGGSSMYLSFLFGGPTGPPASERSQASENSEDSVNQEIDQLFDSHRNDWSKCLQELAMVSSGAAVLSLFRPWSSCDECVCVCW